MRISDGKVSAVHGGDCCDYSILDMEQVFAHVVEFLNKTFPGASFLGGFYDHTRASGLWELSRNDELLGAYRKELENCGLDSDDMKAALRVSTSDVGTSGANLYPILLCGPRQNTIALGDPLRLSHENGAVVWKVPGCIKESDKAPGYFNYQSRQLYDWDYEKGEGSETIYHGSREFVYIPERNRKLHSPRNLLWDGRSDFYVDVRRGDRRPYCRHGRKTCQSFVFGLEGI